MRAARKTISVAAAVAAMTGLAFAAVAYACTALATLSLSAPAGDPGSSVAVTGSGFAAAGATAAAPVLVHFGGVDGPVLAEAVPDRSGNISAPVVIPRDAAPGAQVIVATQKNARGEAQGGTPARAPFQVTGPGAQAAAPNRRHPRGAAPRSPTAQAALGSPWAPSDWCCSPEGSSPSWWPAARAPAGPEPGWAAAEPTG